MKFMKEVGDGQIDFNEVTIQPDASVKENADAWAQMWADQYTASNGNIMFYMCIEYNIFDYYIPT